MRTYQVQYGGRLARHLVYHWVEESWYRELSQICYSALAQDQKHMNNLPLARQFALMALKLQMFGGKTCHAWHPIL